MLFTELKRAVINKKVVVIIISIILLLYIDAYQSLLNSSYFIDTNADDIKSNLEAINSIKLVGGNKYHIWLNSFNNYMVLFCILFITIPFAISFFNERETNFDKFILSRISINKYLFNKIVANALAGGLVLFIAEFIYYIIISALFDSTVLSEFSYYPTTMFYENLFKTNPEKFIWLHLISSFFFGMSFATVALSISSFVRKKVLAYIFPFLFYFILTIVCDQINITALINPRDLYIIWNSDSSYYLAIFELFITFIISSFLFILQNKWRLRYGE